MEGLKEVDVAIAWLAEPAVGGGGPSAPGLTNCGPVSLSSGVFGGGGGT